MTEHLHVVLVTGGRDFQDYNLLSWALGAIHERRSVDIVRHGAMTGADALASRWCYEMGVDTDPVGARWKSIGKPQAGPVRNTRMINQVPVPDICLAFPGGRGTKNCTEQAAASGIPVQFVTYGDELKS